MVEESHGLAKFNESEEIDQETTETHIKRYIPKQVTPNYFLPHVQDNFDKLKQKDKFALGAIVNAIEVLYMQRDYETALSLSQQLLDAEPKRDLREIRETAARCVLKLNRPAQEALFYVEDIALKRKDASLMFFVAQLYLETKRYLECIVQLRRYLDLRSECLLGWRLVSFLFECLKKEAKELEEEKVFEFAERLAVDYCVHLHDRFRPEHGPLKGLIESNVMTELRKRLSEFNSLIIPSTTAIESTEFAAHIKWMQEETSKRRHHSVEEEQKEANSIVE